jgi:hypothetical protein
VTDMATLRVAQLSGGMWINAGQAGTTGSAGGAGSVISASVNSFSPTTRYFTLASSVGTENPLPVKLIYFKGSILNNTIVLNWKIDSPSDADYFELLVADDSRNFKTIGRLSASGNQAEYQFTHELSVSEVNYYQLRVTEKSGKSYLSKIIILNNKASDFKILVSPAVVVNDYALLNIISPERRRLQLMLISMDGRVLRNIPTNIEAGTNRIRLDLSGLPGGIYQIIGFDEKKKSYLVSFIKQ